MIDPITGILGGLASGIGQALGGGPSGVADTGYTSMPSINVIAPGGSDVVSILKAIDPPAIVGAGLGLAEWDWLSIAAVAAAFVLIWRATR